MSNTFFNIFPNENFIDLCMYQFGYEQCDPGHSFGPATRNHYLFHYVLSGTGTLMANNSKGETRTYSVKSGQGFRGFKCHRFVQRRARLSFPLQRIAGKTCR